jgi:uncharacterized protein
MMNPKINFPQKELNEFCRRNRIVKLSFFGSVLRDDFNDESDVDVLVEFDPNARISLIRLAGMEIELGHLLRRRVEIHPQKGINPRFKEEVIQQAQVQYEGA